MSRIGKQLIKVPTGVNIEITETNIKVKGPKGEISRDIPNCLTVVLNKDENTIQITRNSETIKSREIHGLFRSLLSNISIDPEAGLAPVGSIRIKIRYS